MARSKSGRSSDESSGSDDPDQSRSTPNYRRQIDDPNAADADSAFDGTQQKQFDEQDGQSDDSVNHTPAQPSKRWRLPSVSPVKRRQVAVSELDFDCVESHFFIRFPVKPQAWFECQGCALCPIWESGNSCSCVILCIHVFYEFTDVNTWKIMQEQCTSAFCTHFLVRCLAHRLTFNYLLYARNWFSFIAMLISYVLSPMY